MLAPSTSIKSYERDGEKERSLRGLDNKLRHHLLEQGEGGSERRGRLRFASH